MTHRPRRAALLVAACLALCFWTVSALAAPKRFDPAPLMSQASDMLEQGRFLEGVDAYQMVFTHADDPEAKALALTRMAAVYALFLDRKDQALALYGRVVDDYPRQAPPEAVFDRAMLLYEAGRLDEARQGFVAFSAMFPDSPRRFTAGYMAERINTEMAADAPAPLEPEERPGRAEPVIRVALAKGKRVAVSLKAPGTIRTAGAETPLGRGGHAFTAQGGAIALDGRIIGRTAVIDPGKGLFTLGGTEYAGVLNLSASGSTLTAVNALPLETYLLGVVPKEMSPSWPEEALKAQAVAARSYAAVLADKSANKPYDVAATTASQVYGGAGAGNERTRRAVAATRGMMLTDKGRPVLAYFHAHSGGVTEDDANVWTADMPYYKVGRDDASPRAKNLQWTFTATAEQVAGALAAHGFPVSGVTGVRAGKTSPSGRMVTVVADTDAGPVEVKANAFRIWLGAGKMKSVLCGVSEKNGRFIFTGRGYGHGVGMSQWGAMGMAREGHDYQAILGHYYPGADIAAMY